MDGLFTKLKGQKEWTIGEIMEACDELVRMRTVPQEVQGDVVELIHDVLKVDGYFMIVNGVFGVNKWKAMKTGLKLLEKGAINNPDEVKSLTDILADNGKNVYDFDIPRVTAISMVKIKGKYEGTALESHIDNCLDRLRKRLEGYEESKNIPGAGKSVREVIRIIDQTVNAVPTNYGKKITKVGKHKGDRLAEAKKRGINRI